MNLDRQAQAAENGPTSTPPDSFRARRRLLIVVGVALLALCLLLILYSRQIWSLVLDQHTLEQFIAGLGWLGPVALIALNALQIVVAPVPGYVMQLAAGYLYGPLWGGLWGSLGLLSGATLAMWLARTYGRPLVNQLIGEERLDKWEHITHSDSVWLWFLLIVTPTGDLPYFLAGLSRMSFGAVLLLTLAIRVPTTFVMAAAGAGVMLLTVWHLAFLAAGLLVLLVLFVRHRRAVLHWVDDKVRAHSL